MRPIEDERTDTVYGGVASKDIGNLPTKTLLETMPDRSIAKVHRSFWTFAPEERAAIMLGSEMMVDVYGEAVPPLRFAIAEPPLTDLATVARLVDEALAYGVGISISSVLALIGFDRAIATVAGWTDAEKAEVAAWLRQFDTPDEWSLTPPAVLEATADELVVFASRVDERRLALKASSDG